MATTFGSLWRSLVDAIKGTQQDFTQGSISRAVLLLATPMVLEMSMQALFAVVDVFWVTRLGARSVAAVGLTESMLSLVFSVGLGISMSTTAMVARRVGEQDANGASVAAVQAIVLGCVISVAMGVPGVIYAPSLLDAMGATPAVIEVGRGFTTVALGGCVSMILLFINNAIFRGAGDAYAAMRVLWFANLVNIALDPCFIFGLGPFPRLGVTGAAVSTLIGQSCGVLYQGYLLAHGTGHIRIASEHLRLAPKVIGTLLRVSSTGIIQFVIAHTSWVLLVRFISSFGSIALAGYTIAMRIFFFLVLPAWGMSGAAATMMGQNLGAGKPERAQRAVFLTGGYNAIYLLVITLLMVGFPGPIVSVFTDDPAISSYATDCLRIIGFGNVIYAYGMVMVQAFNGAGDTVTPTFINIVGFWLCQVPLAWALAFHFHMKVRGVFAAIPLSEAFITLLGLVMFLRGAWRHKTI